MVLIVLIVLYSLHCINLSAPRIPPSLLAFMFLCVMLCYVMLCYVVLGGGGGGGSVGLWVCGSEGSVGLWV